ncbi:MAG: hypothetical protein HYY01_08685 [Chloroflexi bacterium]|nr:hypothetical protein [Chloroflexota bacterium]
MGLTYDERDGYRYWVRAQYERLDEPWLSYGRIARHYAREADPEDREDLVQDIILALAAAALKRGELHPWLMLTIAKHAWFHYLRDKINLRRRFCSLNSPVPGDHEGTRELWETLADDKALDLDDWADARLTLAAFPLRVLQVAAKRAGGEALTTGERSLLLRCRERGGPPAPTSTGIERFAHIVAERAAQGWGSCAIWRELKDIGFEGSRSAVKYFLGGDKTRELRAKRQRDRRRRQSRQEV